jgi:N-acetylmuramic acid 6-phosphate etherase
MTTPAFHDPRLTEQRNPRTVDVDVASALELVDLINAEDRLVPAVVHEARAAIAATIELAVRAFHAGGRLVYVGAGTSGRLGVLDASECPPTFGAPPETVVGIIAGGRDALVGALEGVEDEADAGAQAMDDHAVSAADLVVGIAASGTTPYVGAALGRAQARGAATVLLTCTDPPEALARTCDQLIVMRVGPEVVTGSTRMKAGTATKLALNTISTGAMLRLGKTYGNLMVDLQAWSEKLHDRAERIVMEVCDVDRATARRAVDAAEGSVKLAIVMVRRGVSLADARHLLAQADGVIRRVIGDPPPVAP